MTTNNHKKKFAIIASERTGSTMLSQALNCQPDVECFGELFSNYNKPPFWLESQYKRGLDKRFYSPSERKESPFEYLDKVLATTVSRFIGFKIMLVQHPLVLDMLVTDKSWQVIRLYRENLLAVYGASLVAKATKQAHVFIGQEAKTAKVVFVAKDFEAFYKAEQRRQKQFHERLHRACKSYLCVEYLDLVSESGLSQIGRYLDIERASEIRPTLQKRHGWNVLERFLNDTEVENYLQSNGLSRWKNEKVAVG